MSDAPGIRLSKRNRRVIAVLLTDPTNLSAWPLAMARLAGVKSGTLYPLLSRLEAAGLVTSEWEERAFPDDGRPRRRLYRLTQGGRVWAWGVLGLYPPSDGPRLRREDTP